MSHDELSITISTKDEGTTVVFTLVGSLDIATSPSVRAALLQESSEGKRDAIVDLTRVEFLDSTGLGALIGAHKRALDNGTDVRLVVSEGPIARLLSITGLTKIFAIYPTLKAALAGTDKVAELA